MHYVMKQRSYFIALLLLLVTGCTSVVHEDSDVSQLTWSDNNKAIADYLGNFGREVEPCSSIHKNGACQQDDAFIDGVLTAFKTLENSATPSLVGMEVIDYIEAVGQAHEMIIDARGTGLSKEQANAGIDWALKITGGVDRITIIGDDYFIGYRL